MPIPTPVAAAVLLLAAGITRSDVTPPVQTHASEIKLQFGVANIQGPPGSAVAFTFEVRIPATGAWVSVPFTSITAPVDVRGRADPRTGIVTWRIRYKLTRGATSATISVAYSADH